MLETLVASGVIGILAAAIYAYVGSRLAKRPVAGEGRLAVGMFAVWWYALAGSTALDAGMRFAGAAGLQDVALYSTGVVVNLLLVCVALWGLLYYLLYLFTGRSGVFAPLGVFYAAYYATLVYVVTASRPVGVEIAPWRLEIVYATPLAGPVVTVLLVLLVFPQILGALAYFTLYFKVRSPTQKYRIALVSWSIVVWFGSAFAGAVAGFGDAYWWPLTTQLIGLAAALAILAAYQPPVWARERWGVTPVAEERA